MHDGWGNEIRSPDGERLYSRAEAAEALGLCDQTISAYKRALGYKGKKGLTPAELEELRRHRDRKKRRKTP